MAMKIAVMAERERDDVYETSQVSSIDISCADFDGVTVPACGDDTVTLAQKQEQIDHYLNVSTLLSFRLRVHRLNRCSPRCDDYRRQILSQIWRKE